MRTSEGHSVRWRASTVIRIVGDTSGGEKFIVTAAAACAEMRRSYLTYLISSKKSEAERVDRAMPFEGGGQMFESCRVRQTVQIHEQLD